MSTDEIDTLLTGVVLPQAVGITNELGLVTWDVVASETALFTTNQMRQFAAAAALKKAKEAAAVSLRSAYNFTLAQELKLEVDAQNKLLEAQVAEITELKAENRRLQELATSRGALAIANGIRMQRAEAAVAPKTSLWEPIW